MDSIERNRRIVLTVLTLVICTCCVFTVCSCSSQEQEDELVETRRYCDVALSIKDEKGDVCSRFHVGENMVFCLEITNPDTEEIVMQASNLFASAYAGQSYEVPSMAFVVGRYEEGMIGCPYDAINDETIVIKGGKTIHLECSWLPRKDGGENSSLFVCNQERQPFQPGLYSVVTEYTFSTFRELHSCLFDFEVTE